MCACLCSGTGRLFIRELIHGKQEIFSEGETSVCLCRCCFTANVFCDLSQQVTSLEEEGGDGVAGGGVMKVNWCVYGDQSTSAGLCVSLCVSVCSGLRVLFDSRGKV